VRVHDQAAALAPDRLELVHDQAGGGAAMRLALVHDQVAGGGANRRELRHDQAAGAGALRRERRRYRVAGAGALRRELRRYRVAGGVARNPGGIAAIARGQRGGGQKPAAPLSPGFGQYFCPDFRPVTRTGGLNSMPATRPREEMPRAPRGTH
jgi:hypothetical protein